MLESQVMDALESIIYTSERMRGKMINNSLVLLLLWTSINFVDSKCNRDGPPQKSVKHPLRTRIEDPGIESVI